jgi:DNA primase
MKFVSSHKPTEVIDQSTIDRIFDAANIVEVVSDYVTLKRRGVNYIGLCPFHNEKTPSFTVSPAKNICKCFGCGKGGNPVNFIMELESFSYVEALKHLAKKYHIEIEEKELTPEQLQQRNTRESLMAVSDWAQQHFSDNLYNNPEGKSVGMSYFLHRGFQENIIKKFQLGYAVNQRDAYTKEAQKKGYKLEYLEKTGLTIVKENNYLLDRFHGRVIFPIHSISGKVIAFGGRAVQKSDPVKYQNSPESEIYHKGQILYGIYFAKNAIIRERKCYIVEGYADVISLVQAGVENVVAPCGTALTSEQIRLLGRILPSVENSNDADKNVVLLYDGDDAGINAALKNGKMLLEEGMNVKIVALPEGEDPDTFAQKNNASDIVRFLEENEMDYILFKTNHFLEGTKNDPIKKAHLISDIASTISVIPDMIKRSVYIKECAGILEIDENIFYSQISKLRKGKIEKELERQYKSNRQHDYPVNHVPDSASVTNNGDDKNKNLFEAEERNIMHFVVRYGEKIMCEVESEIPENGLHITEAITVIEYINREFQEDELSFLNPIYRQMFGEACESQSSPAFNAERFFVYHNNPEFTRTASDLLTDLYQESKMHSKFKKVEPEEDRLLELVPRVVLDFKFKVISLKIKELKEALKSESDPEKVLSLMQEINQLQQVSRALAQQLGERIILKT